ncbi:MAG: DUF4124 domain-containing protein [Candidatus Accumulibacter sp.]|jgi:hypothetical protein|nr:DUF4124 domain-containing protein [Accumulibacter sp.]
MISGRSKRFFLSLILFFAFAAIPTAEAQVYKWKDKNGKIVFGDVPPEGASAEKIGLPDLPSSAQDVSRESTRWQDQEYMFQQRRLHREKEETKAAQNEANKKKFCASLRDRQKYLQTIRGRRVARWNQEKGDYDFLTDEDRAAMEDRTREAIDRSACD